MPKKILGRFSVSWLQVLNEKGAIDRKLAPKVSGKEMLEMYKWMVFSRVFDEKCLALQRQGRIGTYASLKGQEAAQVGSALALKKEDWIFPSFREHAANMARGLPPENIMLYWGGSEWGEFIPKDVNNFTASVPVGTHIPHAVGAGMGMKIQKKKAVALAYFGDGATSKGDFHESMNLAGVFRLPVIFLCQNNQYAISLNVSRQTAAGTLAQKAIGYGFEGIRVDGNDALAVYKATLSAAEKARAGKGPTLIEALTYRIENHTTADDSARYRTKKEVDEWKKKDPIERMEKYLLKKKTLSKQLKEKIWVDSRKRMEEAVEKMEKFPRKDPGEIFDFTFEKKTWNLEEQKKEVTEMKEEGK